jgi:hypothetical protein
VSIYAVNGKEPIAAWIESLDPEPITSSKATDLVGTAHGTLTSMDLTADPDTARRPDTNAGGTRALVFDGNNDYVILPINLSGLPKLTVSMWVQSGNSPAMYFSYSGSGQESTDIILFATSTLLSIQVNNGSDGGANVAYTPSGSTWRHICFVFDGTLTGAANRLKLYVDGSQQTLSFSYSPPATTGSPMSPQCNLARYHAFPAGFFMSGRQDDVRIWFDALDATDVNYLKTSRGIVAATGKKRPRINGSLINSGLCRSKT